MELQTIQSKIYEIRGVKVMLDYDLAELYEVEAKYLKRTVKRNTERFPSDFMFELSKSEFDTLRCQNGTLKNERGKHPKYLPYAFTEQGVAMLSGILNRKKAIEVNISIMRAFVVMRQYAMIYKELTERLLEIETRFKDVYEVINYLLKKDKQ